MPTPEEWSALAAVMALLLGAAAAGVALLQLRQSRAQLSLSANADMRAAEAAESEARPYVSVRLDLQMRAASDPTTENGEGLVFVVVESVGRTPARDIALSVDPPFASSGRGRPDDGSDPALEALQYVFSGEVSVSMLSARQQLRYLLDFAAEALGSESLPQRYEIKASYGDAELSRRYEETHIIDFKPWAMTIAQPAALDIVARQFRRMNQKNEETGRV